MQSKGQKALIDSGLTAAEIAKRLGEDRQRVHDWLKCKRNPSISAKAKMYRVLGIHPTAWSQDADGTGAAPTKKGRPANVAIAAPTTAREGIEAQIRRVMAARAAEQDPSMVLKWEEAERKLWKDLGELNGEMGITLRQWIDSPHYRLWLEKIRVAAEKYPAVADKIMQEISMEES